MSQIKNEKDYFDLHYMNETLRLTNSGMFHSYGKTDSIFGICDRNPRDYFIVRINLTSAVTTVGEYDFSTGEVTGHFFMLNNLTGAITSGGPISEGKISLLFYDTVEPRAQGTFTIQSENVALKGGAFNFGFHD